MTAPVFVDTNVIVYARDARDPLKQMQAMAWLEQLWREGTGRTSMQVLSEYLVTVTRKLAQPMAFDDAWDDVAALLVWNPQVIDQAVLAGAAEISRRYQLSWWDSTVVSAARIQGCALLLSEDLQDGAVLAGVTVRNPFKLAAHEAFLPARKARDGASATRGKRPRR